jgi:hypothetical protein
MTMSVLCAVSGKRQPRLARNTVPAPARNTSIPSSKLWIHLLDDDRMIPMRHESPEIGGDLLLDRRVSHVLDDDTGAMVPIAYLPNEEDVIRIFSACANLPACNSTDLPASSSSRKNLAATMTG